MAALREVGTGHVKIVPDIQVSGDSGVIGGLGALLMRTLATNGDGSNGDGSNSDGSEPAATAELAESEVDDPDASPAGPTPAP